MRDESSVLGVEVRVACVFVTLNLEIIRKSPNKDARKFSVFNYNFIQTRTSALEHGTKTEANGWKQEREPLLCCTADNIYIYNPTLIFPSAQNPRGLANGIKVLKKEVLNNNQRITKAAFQVISSTNFMC